LLKKNATCNVGLRLDIYKMKVDSLIANRSWKTTFSSYLPMLLYINMKNIVW